MCLNSFFKVTNWFLIKSFLWIKVNSIRFLAIWQFSSKTKLFLKIKISTRIQSEKSKSINILLNKNHKECIHWTTRNQFFLWWVTPIFRSESNHTTKQSQDLITEYKWLGLYYQISDSICFEFWTIIEAFRAPAL